MAEDTRAVWDKFFHLKYGFRNYMGDTLFSVIFVIVRRKEGKKRGKG